MPPRLILLLGWVLVLAPPDGQCEPVSSARLQEATSVKVTGTASLDTLDHVNAARLDAMREAIRQVGGLQVRSHEVVRFGEFVKNFTYVRAEALVTSIEPAGGPSMEGGFYRQAYLVKVRPTAVFQDLAKERFDVEFLYDVVRRPRILVAVVDEWNPSGDLSATFVADPDQASRTLIMNGFRERYADIVFQEPRLLREGSAGLQALIEEARGEDFELLIVGETRSQLVAASGTSAREASEHRVMTAGGLPDARAKLQRVAGSGLAGRARFDVSVNWSVVDVSTRRQIVSLRDSRAPLTSDPADFAGAKRIAKEALIVAQTSRMFRELVWIWTQRAFSENYELEFRTDLPPEELAKKLRERVGFVPDSVKLTDSRPGRTRFSATASLGADEIGANLRKTFAPDLRVVATQGGRFELETHSSVRTAVVLVSGLSLSDARVLQERLERITEVTSVGRQPVVAGKVPLQVTTNLSDDDLSVALEKSWPGLRVVNQSATGIECEVAIERSTP